MNSRTDSAIVTKEALFNAVPTPLFLKDANFIYCDCNTALETLLGLKKTQLIGKSIFDIYPCDLAKRYDSIDRELLRDKQPKFYEGLLVDANGRKCSVVYQKSVFYNPYGDVIGIVGAVYEVYLKKMFMDALSVNEHQYSSLLNSAQDALYIFALTSNKYFGKILDVNEAAATMLGYSRDELTNINMYDIDKSSSLYVKEVAKEEQYMFESVHLKKDGTSIPVKVKTQKISFDGQPAYLAMVRDISESKRLQNEMARLERLHLVGEIAASIGHEIRNPMTAVRGFLQTLQRKKGCSMYNDYFQLMIEELDRANSILSEFISLAKNKAGNLCRENINNIINKLSPLLKANGIVNNKYIEFEFNEVQELELDEKEIRQLIVNLVRNGLEAMSEGSYLYIRTYMEERQVVLSVADEGKGIPPEIREQIGKPFVSTKEQGTGLGLAVCYRIAERHRAKITFETGANGTTFYVKFLTSGPTNDL